MNFTELNFFEAIEKEGTFVVMQSHNGWSSVISHDGAAITFAPGRYLAKILGGAVYENNQSYIRLEVYTGKQIYILYIYENLWQGFELLDGGFWYKMKHDIVIETGCPVEGNSPQFDLYLEFGDIFCSLEEIESLDGAIISFLEIRHNRYGLMHVSHNCLRQDKENLFCTKLQ